jgi:hypothetical protein
MIEGSRPGSGSIPLNIGSGSRSPKNTWIRIRIRIRNTGFYQNTKICGNVFLSYLHCSVRDLDPQDTHVFWPSGSGSISQRYGSGSGSFPFLINVLSGLKYGVACKIKF